MDGVEQERISRSPDVRTALLEAAVAGARAQGRLGVVLREAARAAGVSPTAAYRHFAGHADLFASVIEVAERELRRSFEEQLRAAAEVGAPGTPERAIADLWASGRGYVLFAVREPGLFDCLASCPPGSAWQSEPFSVLRQLLDRCVAAGVLDPADRPGAEDLAWIGVHGLAAMVAGGIEPADDSAFPALLERTLRFILRGLGVRAQASPAKG